MTQTGRKSCSFVAMTRGENRDDCLYKKTRFAPTSPPMELQATDNSHSAKTYGPSTLSDRVPEDPRGSHFSGYIEQSRLALQTLRLSFERERAAFAEERKLWEKERAIMKQQIAEMEQGQRKTGRPATGSQGGNHPNDGQHHIWEGSSPTAKPTRIFLDETDDQRPQIPKHQDNDIGHAPSLDEALSPGSPPVDRSNAVGVPIELLDSSLDGITLKSTALPPDIAAKVSSPSASALTSPSQKQTAEPKAPFHLELSELGPPEENLVRDAGHTPMAVITQDPDMDDASTVSGSVMGESPLAPQQTQQPIESSESYFPEVDDDPALQGPLGLKNDETQDHEFLEALDKRLLNEARKIIQASPGSDFGSDEEENLSDRAVLPEQEPEPGIKFKRSTNFGSAFGTI
ncbi:hypothetical protein FQN50_005149 [Emmonsiellopsis sp. PD_5]|nr:hypothetical protein FQN50_005149 [Emmonsiellopsis sp. PD_5]